MSLSQENIRLILLSVTTVLTYLNHRQGKVIHLLVNSKMTNALNEIDSLKKEVLELKGKQNVVRTSNSSS